MEFRLRNAKTLMPTCFIILQDKLNGPSEDCFSCTSSNRESWGRCSSLGGSDEESCADLRAVDNPSQVSLSCVLTHTFMCLCVLLALLFIKPKAYIENDLEVK